MLTAQGLHFHFAIPSQLCVVLSKAIQWNLVQGRNYIVTVSFLGGMLFK